MADDARIKRLLEPRSIAIVGASESSPRHAVRAALAGETEAFLINPRRARVFGVEAYPDLASIGKPVDAVLTLVNADAAVDAVRQAAEAGAGGVVVNAAGFAEAGEQGAHLQRRLVAAAGSMPVLGPNCNGFVNVPEDVFLAGAPELPLRAGGIGIITHSGGFIPDLAVAAVDRKIGFSTLISTGNEAVTDLVDYLDYLIDDPRTRAIGLVVEGFRRPEAFFAAAGRARAAGKPIVALKLGRSARGREVAATHTGAILGAGWVYDAAFRQFGVLPAVDLADLLDRLTLFEQLPADRWSEAAGVAVVSISGGAASLASDVCEQEGVTLPALEGLRAPLGEILPSVGSANPVDLTGFALRKPEVVDAVLETYGNSPEVDTVLGLWAVGLPDPRFGESFVAPFAEAAKKITKPVLLAPAADGPVSDWAESISGAGVAVGRGLRGTVRGLAALGEYARARRRAEDRPPAPRPIQRPPRGSVVHTASGPILGFAATMDLLRSAGVPVAPFAMVGPRDDPGAAVAGVSPPYVVKLADCPHRTDIGAVRVGVEPDGLAGVVHELRALAEAQGLPLDVVVQPRVTATGELFVGAQARGGLGPMVVSGFGGIHVESMTGMSGRIAPFGASVARDLIDEIDRAGLFAGARGAAPLDRDAFVTILCGVSGLVSGASDWLASLDVNPVLAGPGGFVAVDGLACLDPL